MSRLIKFTFKIGAAIVVLALVYTIITIGLEKLGIIEPTEGDTETHDNTEPETPAKEEKDPLEEELEKLNALDGDNLERVTFDAFQPGDIVTFGTYEQDGNRSNGKEPIEWIVLSVDDNRALFLSRYVIDGYKYYKGDDFFYWENSNLRKWLNKNFLENAFNSAERNTIQRNIIHTAINPFNKENAGADTIDKVFVLTLQDMTNPEYGFNEDYTVEDSNRKGILTEYAKGKIDSLHYWDHGDECCSDYWLRSAGEIGETYASVRHAAKKYSTAMEITERGGINCTLLEQGNSGVRPAIYVLLK